MILRVKIFTPRSGNHPCTTASDLSINATQRKRLLPHPMIRIHRTVPVPLFIACSCRGGAVVILEAYMPCVIFLSFHPLHTSGVIIVPSHAWKGPGRLKRSIAVRASQVCPVLFGFHDSKSLLDN